jgi:hypothetical protein
MTLAEMLKGSPLQQQRMADEYSMARDLLRSRHGTIQDPVKASQYRPDVLPHLIRDESPAPIDMQGDYGLTDLLMGTMPMAGITAFHGSPHKFNKFDMSKIGTGEGAQAYGHGLYFAENPGVAKSYAEALGAKVNMGIPQSRLISQGPNKVEMKAVGEANKRMKSSFDSIAVDDYVGKGDPKYKPKPFHTYYDYYNARNDLRYRDELYYMQNKDKVDKRIKSFENKYKKDKNFKKEFHEFMGEDAKPNWDHLKTPYTSSYNSASSAMGEIGQSHLYKVDIPDEQVAKMLDWDKPLSQQPKEIMDAVDKILPKSKRDSLAMRGLFPRDDYTKFHTGKTIAKPLGELTGKEIQVGLRSEVRSAFGSDAQIYREASGDADKFLNQTRGREKSSDNITSALLKREGIPGIKYLDQGSRGSTTIGSGRVTKLYGSKKGGWVATSSNGRNTKEFSTKEAGEKWIREMDEKATSNFVLFDDQIPQILEINDDPIAQSLMR